MTTADETFDFIVVGAGSAGCVMANRLSAGGRYSVCLIEAGGRDNWIWFHIPVGYLFAIGNKRADWLYSTEAEAGLGGRSLAYPRGKVLGGSSAINAMIYMRGQAADYDAWRDRGLPGWGWNDVLPVFKRHEDYHGAASEFHGTGGEWAVARPRLRWEILDAFIAAAEQVGIPRSPDFNCGTNEGSGYFDVNQKRGRRWSAARGFLKPALNRPNLRVLTEAHADKIWFEEKRAAGVVVMQGDQLKRISARREIIICTGAVNTPTLLERSGLGDRRHLSSLGIETKNHLPGVGANLQDHLQIRPIYKVQGAPTLNMLYRSLFRRAWMGIDYALRRRGPLTMAPSQVGAFARSSVDQERPNIQFHVQPLSLDKFGEPMHDFPAITVSVCNLRPKSRGTIHARSNDPRDAPVIAPNYLSHDDDKQVAADSIRKAREIMAAPAMARYRPEEFRPGTATQSDDDLIAAAGRIATTIFHPVGTARMGAEDDPAAVVDARLRVRGTSGLRIADASVMPTITSGNTNSPTMMVAEKGAAMVLEEAR